MILTQEEQARFATIIESTKGLSKAGNRARVAITLSMSETVDLLEIADAQGLDISSTVKRIVQEFLAKNEKNVAQQTETK